MNPRDWHSEPDRASDAPVNETIDFGQPDPALQHEPASAGRIAAYASAALLILGVVFYGLNRPAHENVAARQGTATTTAQAPAEQPTPSQDEASKGSGNPAAGASDKAPAQETTGAAPNGEKQGQPQPKAQQNGSGQKPANAQ